MPMLAIAVDVLLAGNGLGLFVYGDLLQAVAEPRGRPWWW